VHATLGSGGGAGGVDDHERLVRADRGTEGGLGGGHGVQPDDEGIGGRCDTVVVADHDDGVQGRSVRGEPAVHREVVEPAERPRRDDRGDLRVVQHVADLVAAVDRHDRHRDRAEVGQRGSATRAGSASARRRASAGRVAG
jgi:hypothetical protein